MDFNLNTGLFSMTQKLKVLDGQILYDILIIGGGPAGLTAAVYAMRKGMVTGLIAKDVGGQMAETSGIENYLGYRYINGTELVDKFRDQVLQFGIGFEAKTTVEQIVDGDIKQVILIDGRIFKARTLIIASGKQSKKLGVPREKELTGHGVAYCSICDAPFFAGLNVVVTGGGNSGIGAAIDLAKVAKQVTLVQRRDHLTGDQILIDKLKEFPHVDYLYNHVITEIHGDEHVTDVLLHDRTNDRHFPLKTDGVFVEIGLIPNSTFVNGVLEMNDYGEIEVDVYCRTSRPGIFAAGDVTNVPYKQIIVAGGEGAKAALAATDYIFNFPKAQGSNNPG